MSNTNPETGIKQKIKLRKRSQLQTFSNLSLLLLLTYYFLLFHGLPPAGSPGKASFISIENDLYLTLFTPTP